MADDLSPQTLNELIKFYQTNALYKPVSDILHWRDTFDSALAFAVVNFFFILLVWSGYSGVNLISSLFFYWLLVAFIVNIVKKPNPIEEKIKSHHIGFKKEHIRSQIDLIVATANFFVRKLIRVFSGNDNTLAVKFVVGFWVLSIVGKLFTTSGVLYLVAVSSFFWAPVYEQKQADIDKGFDIASQRINTAARELFEKLPPDVKNKFE